MAGDDPRFGGVGGDASGRQPGEDGWPAEADQDRYYFGPYDRADSAPQDAGARPDPLGVGSWTEQTEPIPAQPIPAQPIPADRPTFAAYDPSAFTAPAGVPPLPPRTTAQASYGFPPPNPDSQPVYPAPPAQRRPVRPAAVIAVAALTALVIGGGAGYAGSRLADRSAETAGPLASAPATLQPAPSPSRTKVAPAPDRMNAVAVAAQALPSAVMIRVGGADNASIGSGFVLDTSGLIMTNNHVVADAADGARLRVVFSDGTVAGASLVGRSPTYDIAVIRVKTSHKLVPMPIGDSDDTAVGESVLAIGSPLGLPGTVTQGIVSAKDRPVAVGSEGQSANAYINGTQTDAPINPGNSGGPLLDAGGRVIGVNSAILTLGSGQQQAGNIGIGFAIPINQAMEIGKMLIADGKATYPVIGAEVVNAGDLVGVRLAGVTANGPAARAGLRKGDIITKIDGQVVSSSEQLIVAVRSHRPKDQVTLTYKRDGVVREARVTLGSREG